MINIRSPTICFLHMITCVCSAQQPGARVSLWLARMPHPAAGEALMTPACHLRLHQSFPGTIFFDAILAVSCKIVHRIPYRLLLCWAGCWALAGSQCAQLATIR